jgi:hypothetical protein
LYLAAWKFGQLSQLTSARIKVAVLRIGEAMAFLTAGLAFGANMRK